MKYIIDVYRPLTIMFSVFTTSLLTVVQTAHNVV